MAEKTTVYIFSIARQIAASMELLSRSIVQCQDAIAAGRTEFAPGIQNNQAPKASGGIHVGPGPRLEAYCQQLVGLAQEIGRLTGEPAT